MTKTENNGIVSVTKITDKEVAEEYCLECFQKDRDLFEEARELQKALGLSGLWKGNDECLAMLIKALREKREEGYVAGRIEKTRFDVVDFEQDSTIQILREVEGEVRACFDGWDGAIRNKQQPVPIQDLDYWSNMLLKVIKHLGGDAE